MFLHTFIMYWKPILAEFLITVARFHSKKKTFHLKNKVIFLKFLCMSSNLLEVVAGFP